MGRMRCCNSLSTNRWALFLINFILVYIIMSFVYANIVIRMIMGLLLFMGLYYVENKIIAYKQGKVPVKRKTVINKRKTIWSDDKE